MVRRKRKKDSPGSDNDNKAKRQVIKMPLNPTPPAKSTKGKGKQDTQGQHQASAQPNTPYIMPASFLYPAHVQYPGQYNSPSSQFHQNPASPVLMNSSQNQPVNTDLYSKLDFIMSKVTLIDNIEAKMSKLDKIESQQGNILSRLAHIETSVINNKQSIDHAMKKLSDIEHSQTFISNKYDKMSDTVDKNNSCVLKLQGEVKVLSDKNAKLKTEKDTLAADVLDLKCRSMRDNMIFLGIDEHIYKPVPRFGHLFDNKKVHTPMDSSDASNSNQSGDRSQSPDGAKTYAQSLTSTPVLDPNSPEDCASKVYEFCESVLNIDDVRNKIYIDRAHRIGGREPGKTRPIVAKFLNTSSKLEVKRSLKNADLKQTQYAVFDQHPKIVQERRKALIPIMVQARKDNKRAVLVGDKLYINNELYSPTSTD